MAEKNEKEGCGLSVGEVAGIAAMALLLGAAGGVTWCVLMEGSTNPLAGLMPGEPAAAKK